MTNEERIEKPLNSRFRRHFGGGMEDVRTLIRALRAGSVTPEGRGILKREHFDRALADLEAVPGESSAKGPVGFA